MFCAFPASTALLFSAFAARKVRPLLVSAHPVSRAKFVSGQAALLLSSSRLMAFSTAQPPRRPTSGDVDAAISLLNGVYGPPDSPNFPLPMPSDEAGLCCDGAQRRYLWTDAFGVLSYVSLADECDREGKTKDAESYRRAANVLVDTVHRCLGSPRSNQPEDAMQVDDKSPTGHVGLRIGKVEPRRVTDYGMRYDGMYWHYVDKWLLALARADRVDDGIKIAKSCFPRFFDPAGGGIRWKLSVDGTPPPSLEYSRVSDDDLTALIVFSLLENRRTADMPSLSNEIKTLQSALASYRPRVTDDPLGWGLEALFDEYLEGHPRRASLVALRRSALHPGHLSLPFRLYGAMIGARVAGDGVASAEVVDELIRTSVEHEKRVEKSGYEEHSSINRVMLAMCLLCPGALGRKDDDPVIKLHG